MSVHNLLHIKYRCIRCNQYSHFDIECFFGFGNLTSLTIGAPVQWVNGKSEKNGGRPEDGNLRGEGYAECSLCHKDFFVDVIIENDIVIGVDVNLTKTPYIE
ncbi:MAG: hypothetical protein GY757_34435 [bacterium]|nr:hypothetical protein [bacterium]